MIDLGRGSWSPPPPAVIAQASKKLDANAVESVLYIASPAGLAQLTSELHRRGYVFTSDELKSCAILVERAGRASIIEVNGVTMFALNGLSR